MNRIIKFRAWSNGQKRMFYDVDVVMGEPKYEGAVSIGAELMQFTGLTDKNGKEIYEEDILSTKSGVYEIRYYDKVAGFGAYKGNFRTAIYQLRPNFEVIGNIYENPELLEPNQSK